MSGKLGMQKCYMRAKRAKSTSYSPSNQEIFDEEKVKVDEDTSYLQSENETMGECKRICKVSLKSEESDGIDSESMILPSSPSSPILEGKKEMTMLNDSAAGDAAPTAIATAGPSSSRRNDSGKCQSCIEKEKYLQTIIKQNHLIRGLLVDMAAEIKQLRLNQKVAPVSKQPVSFYTRYEGLQFPLTREEDVSLLETYLAIEGHFEDAVQELSKIGGNNNYQFVKRVLSSILHNELALKYSWLGRKGKKVFCILRLAKLVISAAETANLADTKRLTEVSIQNWLRRAFDRKNATRK